MRDTEAIRVLPHEQFDRFSQSESLLSWARGPICAPMKLQKHTLRESILTAVRPLACRKRHLQLTTAVASIVEARLHTHSITNG